MTYDDSSSSFVFADGTRAYAHAAIIGIEPCLELNYGYDGGFRPEGDGEFTAAQIDEIADYNIALWQRLKAEKGTK